MRRTGLTLLELMVVLAVVVAVAAVVAPFAGARLVRAELDGAGGHVEAFVRLARAESQRRAELIRVVAERDGRGVVWLGAERFAVEEGPLEDWSEWAAGNGGAGESGRLPVAARVPPVSLPRGVRVGSVERALGELVGAGGGEPEEGEAFVLAVFLPDGQVVMPRPAALWNARGARVVEIGRWTGRVRFERLDEEGAGEAGLGGAPPPPPAMGGDAGGRVGGDR